MTTNVGTFDRIVRIAVGVLLIAYAIPLGFSHTGWNWVGWVGIVPIVTGGRWDLSACRLFGLSTCPLERNV